jgi:hypothetical protein
MLIHIQEHLDELERLRDYADRLRQKFELGSSAEDLLLDAESLDLRLRAAISQLPDQAFSGNSIRHLMWLLKELRAGSSATCRGDIDDLALRDIPDTITAVKKWIRKMDYLDAELRDGVLPLLKTSQFDSAIRKSFVILTERLRTVYSLPTGVDGAELVNLIFGKAVDFHQSLDDRKRQAYRNLISGMYGVIRNKFVHGDEKPTLAELEASLASVNLCLQIIEELKAIK